MAGGFQFDKSPGASSVESLEHSANEDQDREDRDTEREIRDHESSEDDDISLSSPSKGPAILLSAPPPVMKTERSISTPRKNSVTFPEEVSMSPKRRKSLPESLANSKSRRKSLTEVKEFAGEVRDWWNTQENNP